MNKLSTFEYCIRLDKRQVLTGRDKDVKFTSEPKSFVGIFNWKSKHLQNWAASLRISLMPKIADVIVTLHSMISSLIT